VGNCGSNIAPGVSCNVFASFAPTSAGPKSATLLIAHNALGSSTSIALTGTGTSPTTSPGSGTVTGGGTVAGTVLGTQPTNAKKLSLPTNLDFGVKKVRVNHTKAVTVTNRQRTELPIFFVNTSGGAFKASRGNCPIVLGVGKSCKLMVTFKPSVAGKDFKGLLKLSGNSKQLTMTLTGKGRR
jgi:hypothetical protein